MCSPSVLKHPCSPPAIHANVTMHVFRVQPGMPNWHAYSYCIPQHGAHQCHAFATHVASEPHPALSSHPPRLQCMQKMLEPSQLLHGAHEQALNWWLGCRHVRRHQATQILNINVSQRLHPFLPKLLEKLTDLDSLPPSSLRCEAPVTLSSWAACMHTKRAGSGLREHSVVQPVRSASGTTTDGMAPLALAPLNWQRKRAALRGSTCCQFHRVRRCSYAP